MLSGRDAGRRRRVGTQPYARMDDLVVNSNKFGTSLRKIESSSQGQLIRRGCIDGRQSIAVKSFEAFDFSE